jgi:hypothetical protein
MNFFCSLPSFLEFYITAETRGGSKTKTSKDLREEKMKALKRKSLLVTGLSLMALLMLNLLVSVQTVQAAGEAKEYVQFNAAIPLADNLMALKGKTVTVSLSSGQTMTGVVKDVKDHLLHLERLSQKEFYDAIIRLELISAVEARVR